MRRITPEVVRLQVMWAYRSPPDTGPRAQHPEEPPSNNIFRALVDWSDVDDAALVLWVWAEITRWPPCFGGGRNPPLR
eukprot:scaffold22535_cov23-Cyclotella_meneghiniana.AAC.1